MSQSGANKIHQCTGERSTTGWRRWLYLSKLWRPNKNIPQRHNQLLFGDAMGVVRRLEKEELQLSRGRASAHISNRLEFHQKPNLSSYSKSKDSTGSKPVWINVRNAGLLNGFSASEGCVCITQHYKSYLNTND